MFGKITKEEIERRKKLADIQNHLATVNDNVTKLKDGSTIRNPQAVSQAVEQIKRAAGFTFGKELSFTETYFALRRKREGHPLSSFISR